MSRTRAVLTAAVLLSALAVGGCTDDDPEPKFGPTESTSPASPTSTAASGPIAPSLPAAALGSDASAAETFVEFYWDTVNFAQRTGDVTSLRSLGVKCTACDKGVEFIENAYAGGGQIRGGHGQVSDLETVFIDRDGENWAVVSCRVESTKQVVDMPGSDRDEQYQGGAANLRLYLQPTDDGWVVRSLATK
ncbi:DUF6318 family protein [Nocardioides hankookensis]|uniref:DUF6318 family protein n=1 Tax=Nocardioides hankookensis TaxID=443157 RepID=UPI0036D3C919